MESDPNYVTTPRPNLVEYMRADQCLDEAHQGAFDNAVSNVLFLKIAEITFAQILDGFPLKDNAFGNRGHGNTIWDPTHKHKTLCPGVMDRVIQFRESFNPKEMDIEVEALRRFQSVPADSRASHLALIELTARAVHRIAVLLFKLDDSCHKGESPFGERPEGFPPVYPTPFTLSDYRYVEQYPDGVADVVGYWAEDQIFGGVVLFERIDGSDEYKEVWFHSHRDQMTRRPYALTEDQKASLVHFIRAAKPDDGVLPILGDRTNRRRVDSEIAIPEYGIYRDRWERQIERCDYNDYVMRRRDVWDDIDYPDGPEPLLWKG